jgi:uncharacterized protein (TIGR03000 family)
MIVFVRVPRAVFWVGLGGFVLVSLSYNLCNPDNWRYFTPRKVSSPPAAVKPAEAAKIDESGPKDEDARAILSIQVPANAELWLEGRPTTQTGASRRFRTPSLTPGADYDYHVRARWSEWDLVMDQTRRVTIRGGVQTTVDFTHPAADGQ